MSADKELCSDTKEGSSGGEATPLHATQPLAWSGAKAQVAQPTCIVASAQNPPAGTTTQSGMKHLGDGHRDPPEPDGPSEPGPEEETWDSRVEGQMPECSVSDPSGGAAKEEQAGDQPACNPSSGGALQGFIWWTGEKSGPSLSPLLEKYVKAERRS
jgi:hypothetical protein